MERKDTYYDQIAEGYEELHKEEQLKKIELIKQHFSVKKTDRLLDVGCGTGLTTVAWDCIKYGIDPARKLIERAHKGPEYRVAAAENIPYPDHSFDVVISITAIQNFEDTDKGLKEIKRVGKKRFLLSFLKKSSKKEEIDKLIRKIFDVNKVVEEEKDLIYFVG
jgi:ubiquinone/menaquinone biosynthesis C-methylase UbiE